MRGTWTTIDVDGSAMETYVATPDGPGPFPAVIVAMHVFGIGDFVGGKCDELADAGYVAVAPYLFHRSSVSNAELAGISATDPKRFEVGLPLKDQLTDADIERDMLEALAHARSMPQVGATAGITGFCIGGRIAYLLAAKTEEFGACGIFYGTDIAEAWGDGPTPLSLTPYLDCALAGFFGNDDTNPSPADVDTLDAELDKHGKSHAFHRYDGAPHAFNDPFNPIRHNPEASADSWPKLVDFFDAALKATATA